AMAMGGWGCSFSPDLGNGDVRCGAGGQCPPGQHCQTDRYCHADGSDGGTGGNGDAGGLKDLGSCNPRRCQPGWCGPLDDGCGHTPDCGPCDPGDDLAVPDPVDLAEADLAGDVDLAQPIGPDMSGC